MSEIVRIGSLREPVELIERPRGGPEPRVGRIRHANGENAEIDLATLERLLSRAADAAESADRSREEPGSRPGRETGRLLA